MPSSRATLNPNFTYTDTGEAPVNWFGQDAPGKTMQGSVEDEKLKLLRLMAEHGTAAQTYYEEARTRMEATADAVEGEAAGRVVNVPEPLLRRVANEYQEATRIGREETAAMETAIAEDLAARRAHESIYKDMLAGDVALERDVDKMFADFEGALARARSGGGGRGGGGGGGYVPDYSVGGGGEVAAIADLMDGIGMVVGHGARAGVEASALNNALARVATATPSAPQSYQDIVRNARLTPPGGLTGSANVVSPNTLARAQQHTPDEWHIQRRQEQANAPKVPLAANPPAPAQTNRILEALRNPFNLRR